ncbi:MAG: hypothetical protein QM648_01025 [Solirubrobacterales bacterium]
MRIKLIAIATALVALAVGVATSHAALQNAVGVNVNFKKAGGPGTLQVQLINFDGNLLSSGGGPANPTKALSDADMHTTLYQGGGLVPQRVKQLIVKSTSAKFNSKAPEVGYCKLVNPDTGATGIPTRATGMTGAETLTPIKGETNPASVLKNCPLKTMIGSGTFTAVVGQVGTAYNPSQAGALEGKIYVYNYKPAAGDALGTIALLHVDNPVPANQYLYNGVSKSGVLTANIPARSEIPTNLDASIPAGEVVMTSLNLKLTAPKPKKKNGKPIFTIKSFSNLNVYGRMVRE